MSSLYLSETNNILVSILKPIKKLLQMFNRNITKFVITDIHNIYSDSLVQKYDKYINSSTVFRRSFDFLLRNLKREKIKVIFYTLFDDINLSCHNIVLNKYFGVPLNGSLRNKHTKKFIKYIKACIKLQILNGSLKNFDINNFNDAQKLILNKLFLLSKKLSSVLTIRSPSFIKKLFGKLEISTSIVALDIVDNKTSDVYDIPTFFISPFRLYTKQNYDVKPSFVIPMKSLLEFFWHHQNADDSVEMAYLERDIKKTFLLLDNN